MEERTGVSAKITAFFKGGKATKWIVALGVIGIGLILLSEFWPQKTQETAAKATAQDFVADTEKRLTEMISNISGAGQCRVMVTLENGVEYVYATEQKINSDRTEDTGGSSSKYSQRDDSEESIILVEVNGERQGLLVKEIQPTVRGVVIICEGGDDPAVQEQITDAVTTALNISTKRVSISKLSSSQ